MGSLSGKPITTKALVVDKPGAPFVLEDVVLDKLRDNELLVDIKYSGLCHTVSFNPMGTISTLTTLSGPCHPAWEDAHRWFPGSGRP